MSLILTCTMTCCMCEATQTIPGGAWYERYDDEPINGWHVDCRIADRKAVYMPFCPNHLGPVKAYNEAFTEWQHGIAEARRLASKAFGEANPLPELEWPEDS